jgi:hypothetical protein
VLGLEQLDLAAAHALPWTLMADVFGQQNKILSASNETARKI